MRVEQRRKTIKGDGQESREKVEKNRENEKEQKRENMRGAERGAKGKSEATKKNTKEKEREYMGEESRKKI